MLTKRFLVGGASFVYASAMQQNRKEMASTIVNSPHAYKICLICGGIVDSMTPVCPDCGAYRFNDTPDDVMNQALTLASEPEKTISRFDLDADE